jgi:hypothetical protein
MFTKQTLYAPPFHSEKLCEKIRAFRGFPTKFQQKIDQWLANLKIQQTFLSIDDLID